MSSTISAATLMVVDATIWLHNLKYIVALM